MSSKYTGTAIVIPTRNRSQLAINAVNSAVRYVSANVKIIVSDNSTDEREAENIRSFCQQKNLSGLFYIRPAEPLPMTAHWEWFRKEIAANFSESHLLLLNDRMIFINHKLEEVLKCAAKFPEKVISFGIDEIDDRNAPYVFRQSPRTYKFYRIESNFFLKFSSRSKWHGSIPRMSNCIVPTSVFNKIVSSFESVFESISPDFCFAYKCLDVIDEFFYYDGSVILSHNLNHSNGGGFASGNFSSHTKDFFSQLEKDKIVFNSATPVPEFYTLINAIVQEYCYIKSRSTSGKFPELNLLDYFQANKKDIELLIDNEKVKSEMLKLYVQKYQELKKSIVEDEESQDNLPFFDKAATKLVRTALSLSPSVKEEFYGRLTTWKTLGEALDYADKTPVKKQRIGLSSVEYDLGAKLPTAKLS